jgi:hypothetical protein
MSYSQVSVYTHGGDGEHTGADGNPWNQSQALSYVWKGFARRSGWYTKTMFDYSAVSVLLNRILLYFAKKLYVL